MNDRKRKLLFIGLPVLLTASASCVFYFAARLWGRELGYLIGFLFYWLIWCLLVPLLLLGRRYFTMLRDKRSLFRRQNWWVILLLASTVIMPVFMYLIPRFSVTPLPVMLLGIPLALIHGFFEETFWRGLYVAFFPGDVVMGLIYPALFFSLWHIAPQLAIPAASPAMFILSTIPLGLAYGLTAFATKSAKWSAIAHGVSGVLAFSGYLAPSLYAILN